jgi:DNA-binding response OmpR family regulator
MIDGKHVILYVDDDLDLLLTMRVVLEKNGYIMKEATSAELGLRVYKECSPDLVIVDLMMEEIDAGARLVKELMAAGNKAPVYMLSSMGDNLSATTSYSDLGLAGIFQKPIMPDRLLRILDAKLKKPAPSAK